MPRKEKRRKKALWLGMKPGFMRATRGGWSYWQCMCAGEGHVAAHPEPCINRAKLRIASREPKAELCTCKPAQPP